MNKRLKKKKGLLIEKEELTNLDKTLARYILPRVKRFREINKQSYPADLKDMKQWNKILDSIIWAFDYSLNEEKIIQDEKEREKNQRKYKKGMKLFSEYFEDLWI